MDYRHNTTPRKEILKTIPEVKIIRNDRFILLSPKSVESPLKSLKEARLPTTEFIFKDVPYIWNNISGKLTRKVK